MPILRRQLHCLVDHFCAAIKQEKYRLDVVRLGCVRQRGAKVAIGLEILTGVAGEELDSAHTPVRACEVEGGVVVPIATVDVCAALEQQLHAALVPREGGAHQSTHALRGGL